MNEPLAKITTIDVAIEIKARSKALYLNLVIEDDINFKMPVIDALDKLTFSIDRHWDNLPGQINADRSTWGYCVRSSESSDCRPVKNREEAELFIRDAQEAITKLKEDVLDGEGIGL